MEIILAAVIPAIVGVWQARQDSHVGINKVTRVVRPLAVLALVLAVGAVVVALFRQWGQGVSPAFILSLLRVSVAVVFGALVLGAIPAAVTYAMVRRFWTTSPPQNDHDLDSAETKLRPGDAANPYQPPAP